MHTIILANGTYTSIRPVMGPRDATVTAIVQDGQITAGTYTGNAMPGRYWRACTLADLNTLSFEFTSAPCPIGKASACELRKDLAWLGYARAVWSYACAQMSLPAAGGEGHDAASRDTLHGLADRLSWQTSRVDYRGRRERLAGLTTLSLDDWQADWQATAMSAGLRSVEAASRQPSAAAWIWSEVLGGISHLCLASNMGGGNRRPRVDMCWRFSANGLASLSRGQSALACELGVLG